MDSSLLFPNSWVIYGSQNLETLTRPLPHFATVSIDPGDCSVPRLRYDPGCSVIDGHNSGRMGLVIGTADCRIGQLQAVLTTNRCTAEWFAEHVPGAYHGIILERQSFRVFATTAGVLQIYYTEYDSGLLVSNSAVLLAYLTGNHEIDTETLAGYLFNHPPTAHTMRPLLVAAQPIPVGSELTVRGGIMTLRPFWTPWESPMQDMPVAAREVRYRVRAAVKSRVLSDNYIGCDLSGGLDSTSLAFVTTDLHDALTLYTIDGQERVGEDRHWSSLAAKELAHVRRRVLPRHETPSILDDLYRHIAPLDRPNFGHPSAARFLATVMQSHDDGAELHLNGLGGDQLFVGPPAVMHDSIRTRPIAAWSQLTSITQSHNWRWRDVIAGLRDDRDHVHWWKDQRDMLFEPISPTSPHFGWALPCRLPAWATPDGVAMAQRCLSHVAEQASLGPSRGRSAMLESVLACSRQLHTMVQLAAYSGGRPEAPFLDMQVVSAALSADPVKAVTASSYKPLLRACMRGIVPDRLLSRVSKDAAAVEAETGLVRNRDWLHSIWSTSRLADLGLVDGPRLIKTCLNPSSKDLTNYALFATLGCELWLRGVEMIPR
jgi:asparagine synthase (glutamine-hydrolysing)